MTNGIANALIGIAIALIDAFAKQTIFTAQRLLLTLKRAVVITLHLSKPCRVLAWLLCTEWPMVSRMRWSVSRLRWSTHSRNRRYSCNYTAQRLIRTLKRAVLITLHLSKPCRVLAWLLCTEWPMVSRTRWSVSRLRWSTHLRNRRYSCNYTAQRLLLTLKRGSTHYIVSL